MCGGHENENKNEWLGVKMKIKWVVGSEDENKNGWLGAKMKIKMCGGERSMKIFSVIILYIDDEWSSRFKHSTINTKS